MNEQSPATLDRSGLRPLWLGLGALLLAFLFPPAGMVAGVAAVVVAVRVRRRAAGSSVPGAAAGLAMGLISTLLSTASLALTLFTWNEWAGYQECLRVANTHTDEQSCKDVWLPKLEQRMHMPKGTFTKYDYLF